MRRWGPCTAALAVLGAALTAGLGPAKATNDPLLPQQWALARIGAPAAWSSGTGTGVTIGVVDSGADLAHEDLQGRIAASTNCTGAAGDPAKCAGTGQDDHGHGTHVAGIAAATGGNGRGVSGVAPGASLLIATALDASGSGTLSDIEAAIEWVVDRGARVVNLSLGPETALLGSGFGDSIGPALEYAWSKGAVPVVASGNANLLGLGLFGGAGYGNVNALVVGATGPDDRVTGYSSPTESAKWALLAPGGASADSAADGVLSTYWRPGQSNQYAPNSGTSMAAPHVSGAVAVLLGRGFSAQQAVDRILATVNRSVACGSGDTNCHGRLDLAAAVAGLGPVATTSTTGPGATTTTVPQGPGAAGRVSRLAGGDRVDTAIEASRDAFPVTGTATGVVLANGEAFADALAGTPLATAKRGPLLLTGQAQLDDRVAAEIRRVLPAGSDVHVLGGGVALSTKVDRQLEALGYRVVRHAGANRFATAVDIAERGLGSPAVVVETTGRSFADALAGGNVAAALRGAVLLTDGASQSSETAAYLSARSPRRIALGGAAAAADPGAQSVVGADRFETAAIAARTFFSSPAGVGLASGAGFADALAGGAHVGARHAGPMLLVPPTGSLPAPVASYLREVGRGTTRGWLYGGPSAVTDEVRIQIERALAG